MVVSATGPELGRTYPAAAEHPQLPREMPYDARQFAQVHACRIVGESQMTYEAGCYLRNRIISCCRQMFFD